MVISVFDDEPYFCNQISKILHTFFSKYFPDFEYRVEIFSRTNEFEKYLSNNTPDIFFLDINIENDQNYGINIAKKIREKSADCHIVFLTSYTEKIDQVLSDLIKPSQFLTKPLKIAKINKLMNDIVVEFIKSDNYITLKFRRYHYVVNVNDIIAITKKSRNTVFMLPNRQIEITEPVKNFFDKLPSCFITVDKGTVVNLYKIIKVDYANRYIYLTDNINISMSRNSKKKVETALMRFNLMEK